MKRLLAPVLAAGLWALGATARAADGTIDFTGSVIGTTCTVTINGVTAPALQTITLAPASDSSLGAAGMTAMPTPFSMVLTRCTGIGRQVYAYFESGGGINGAGRMTNTFGAGAAANVELQLYDNGPGKGASFPITIGGAQTGTTRQTITGSASNGSTTLPYGVQYYATGVGTVGGVKGTVTYHLDYI